MAERLGPETRAILQAIRSLEKTDKPLDVLMGDFKAKYVGGFNVYKVTINNSDGAIDCPVAYTDVTKALRIPFPFKLLRAQFSRTDSTGADTSGEWFITIRRVAARNTPSKGDETIFSEERIGCSMRVEKFDDVYEPCDLDIIVQSENANDKIFPVFYIERGFE
jgi:hypothetical protein